MSDVQANSIRKKPAIRKSTVTLSDKPRMSEAQVSPNSITAKFESYISKLTPHKNVIGLMIISALASSLITFVATNSANNSSSSAASTSTFSEVVAGKVMLSESELIDAVKQLGVDVYWAGPVKDAKYTLSVPSTGQAYVRYLPNGQGLNDTQANFVVIATYETTNAFDATQAAGNQTDGITFINPDGAAVYYSKTSPTNVYIAYPGKNVQIEVFHPVAATALDIASKSGALKLVK